MPMFIVLHLQEWREELNPNSKHVRRLISLLDFTLSFNE